MTRNPTAIPVAVVGMSAIYPGETGLAGFWRTIISGRDAISDVPASHWLIDDYFDPDPTARDKTYCKRGGFIDPAPFDPMQFGLPPTALPATDSAQLLALIAAKQALDEASRGAAKVDPDRISVVLGVASTTELVVQMGSRLQRPIWRKALLENGIPEDEADDICRDIADHYAPWQESTFPGLLGNVVAGRIANRLNLGGSNYVTDAACASSLSALQVALHELYLDEADMVLTGGVDALNDIMMFMCFSKTPAFSPTGDCRPFSDAADGTIIGEGVGMLALKRLSDAERDGDVIHAVIRGLGSSSDGRASSVYAPRSEGQAKALRRAYERAGYAPSTVGLLEAHGTATKAGDAAEFAGLASVFADGEGVTRCALGSVKSQIGHTKAAAGAAGLIKAVLSLQHAALPGTAKVTRPNPALGLEKTSFYVNSQSRPWVHAGEHPRRASVSSFGFGGSNFHVTLEEYRGDARARRVRTLQSELVLLSAESEQALAVLCGDLLEKSKSGETLARVAHDAASTFDVGQRVRAGVVATDAISLEKSLDRLRKALATGGAEKLKDADIALGVGPAREGKTAFLFPGQGSQYVGMGSDLAMTFPEALDVWDTLPPACADVASITFPEPAFDDAARDAQKAALTMMVNAQPAIAAVSLSQLALLVRLGVTPDAAAGHSFGELTALAAAGTLPSGRLAEIARTRGALMTEAAGGQAGAMLAVAASVEGVATFLAGDPVLAAALVVANDNAPGQVVLAGLADEIAQAERLAKAAGITAFRLPVASAFHSPLMAGSVTPFADYLKSIKTGRAAYPVYANATAKPYGKSVARQLADQLQTPVRFREMIEAMARDGVTRFVEVGPGRVLTGLVDQILADTPHIAVALDDRKAGGLRGWHRGLAALAADGVALDLAALFQSYETPPVHVEPPAHAVMVGGANLGKPYPPAGGKVVITPKRVRAEAPPIVAAMAPPSTIASVAQGLPEDAWSVIDRIQNETVVQHRHYVDVMAQSHQAFLDMSSQLLAQITGAPAPTPRMVQTASAIATPIMPAPIMPASTYDSAPVMVPMAAATVVAPAPAPQDTVSPEGAVLAIVSEKTGYPIDMLGLDMEMEAELGIDSIKQVDILSAVQARFPRAPEIAASELATLRTLRDVARKIDTLAEGVEVAATVPEEVAPPARPGAQMWDRATLETTVLAVVAEKTGYPVDMLGLNMELEAELGIDSIKQVEILSAMQDRWPGAPEVSPSALSGIKSLRDIVHALGVLEVGASGDKDAQPPRTETPGLPPASGLETIARRFTTSPPAGFGMAGLRDGEVFVIRENAAFAEEIVAALAAHGIKARAVDTPPDGAGAVISLAALASDGGDCLAVHMGAFRAARAVARSRAATRVFVTVQSTGGDFSAGPPMGVSAIVKTAAREWTNASVKAIDLATLDAPRLVDELLTGAGAIEVGLRGDGARLTSQDQAIDASTESTFLEMRGGVVIVTGGARGVTAHCAMALAERHGVRLALLGRTTLDDIDTEEGSGRTVAEVATSLVSRARARGEMLSLVEARHEAARLLAQREVSATLAKAVRRGVEARYFTADVLSAPDVDRVLDSVRAELGDIVGLVHGAGVLADKRLADMDDDQFEAVFATKVLGLETLLDAMRGDALCMISLFSSVAAHTGNAGQGAYAAANEVLNGVARREAALRGPSCAVRAFGWGPWDGGMVDEALKRRFESAGVEVIQVQDGAAYFAQNALVVAEQPVVVVSAPARKVATGGRLEWTVSSKHLPPLVDHMVRGRIVLPVVVVLERIVRGVRALTGSTSASLVVRDLQVLSGLTFVDAVDKPSALTLCFEPSQTGWSVVVRDGAERPRYRAVVEVGERVGAAVQSDSSAMGAWPLTLEEAYAGPLFHGPRFAALDRLVSYGEAGGGATLKTHADLAWPSEPWAIDPAALDGGLQLGLLWANANGRPLMLPQRIARFSLRREFPATGALLCRFLARPVSDKRIDFDFLFETQDGQLVAELEGSEFYAVGAAASAAP